MNELIFKSLRAPSRRTFVLAESARMLDRITEKQLPEPGEVYKFLSLSGGVSSISFVKWVAVHEPLVRFQASTLRIGAKQFRYLDQLARAGKLGSARFILSSMQTDMDSRRGRYDYAADFARIAERNGWQTAVVNNHSKILLMATKSGKFVLETSSNLNENPKIEQYSFENNSELYDFYSAFFDALCGGESMG